MKSVLTLTMNPAIDMSSHISQVVPEQKMRCDSPRYEPGGGGINVSRAIQKLGGTSTAFYLSGGKTGELLSELLDKENVEHQEVGTESWTRLNFTAFEEHSNQQYRFGMPGPDVNQQEWKKCLDVIKHTRPKPDFIVASGSLPPGVPDDFYSKVATLAIDSDIHFVLDTSKQALTSAFKEKIFLIKPNVRELQQLAGQELNNEKEQEDFVRQFIDDGKCEIMVVSMGSAGVLLGTKDHIMRLRSPSVPIRSKIGAGDSTVAGILIKLAQDENVIDSVQYGIAAGAGAVMTKGTELCRKNDVDQIYNDMKHSEKLEIEI